ncbi:MAG: CoB--CoM heterodisulfide reductase iron-sulfur subunit A family protein [Deltaproteobacteria bacterium]|nr:CoB--CoM heterodisulfide reductase iron-sulfur subunit A family protein [Deltaproteobacteria bacterium]MCL5277957.1 CoB--CoM heterodisulfide reductase iron-sulfur subunit A family protein [Deltaproteobacteria bacterium]
MGNRSVCVIGGGISGMTTAIEAAEVGYEVYLIEKAPSLGGRVVQMNQYFPKLCPPQCGVEINYRRIRVNPRIRHFTLAEVEGVSGIPGNFDVTVRMGPRYVNEKCTSCNKCTDACPVERQSDYDYGMGKTKAIYLPHEMAFPMRYVIDDTVCLKEQCSKCVAACRYDAIELSMKPKSLTINVGSVVLATGWSPYHAIKIDNLKFGIYRNVIRNVEMERLAAPNGPTKGKILSPSDKKEIKSIAFVQCAGSRDENHLAYCSSVCCLASMKQATYVRSQYPDADIFIFYIDIRATGRFEDFYVKLQTDRKISFIKGKVAKIIEDEGTKALTVVAEDILSGKKVYRKVDMVVLATGMVPNGIKAKMPADIVYDEFGFAVSDLQSPGIYVTGCTKKPADVASCIQDATGTALKAIQTIVGV